MLHPTSISTTLDAVNEALFFGHPVTAKDREEVAEWLAGHQGKPGSYANMFAPTKIDFAKGLKLFSGETVRSSASMRHVTGEEVCRAITLLKPKSKVAREALKRAQEGMLARLRPIRPNEKNMFCCGTCDPALWRHITVGGLPGEEDWIPHGLKGLNRLRVGDGKWHRFPFFFTLLALSDIDLPAARAEIKYAAPVIEKYLARTKPSDKIKTRRRAILEQCLGKL